MTPFICKWFEQLFWNSVCIEKEKYIWKVFNGVFYEIEVTGEACLGYAAERAIGKEWLMVDEIVASNWEVG